MLTIPLVVPAASLAESLAGDVVPAVLRSAWVAARAVLGLLELPFDTARAQYAQAVQAGLLERSVLASRDVERALDLAEQLALGPLARHA
jgi:hypothetical protein